MKRLLHKAVAALVTRIFSRRYVRHSSLAPGAAHCPCEAGMSDAEDFNKWREQGDTLWYSTMHQ